MLKKLTAIILAAAIAITFAGCGDRKIEKKTKKDENESIISVFSYKPDTLCPVASNNQANIDVLGIIYEGLVQISEKLTPIPCLAESWSGATDCTQWTVKLRNNAKWHDGSEFSAQDVVYTVNLIKQLEKSPYLYNVSGISEISAVDAYTVEILLSKPCANFMNLLYFPIIKESGAEPDLVNFNAVGTGPYKLQPENDGNIYYLKKNPEWWGGNVKTETIQIRMLPGGDTPLYAFGSDSIDLIPADNLDWGKFVDPTESEYTSVATPVYTFLGINHKNPQLAMKELRRAISLVIDREELIDETRLGYGVAVNSPVRPEWFVCENQNADLKQNTEAAKKLLEENHWTLSDGLYKKVSDGVEYKAVFTILVNEENTVRCNVAAMLANTLEEFGIKASVVKVAFEEYEKRIAEGSFDTFVGSMGLSPELDYLKFVGEGNVYGFEDEEMRFVATEMQKKQTEDEIKNAYAEFINLFEQLNPVTGLYFEDSVMLYSKQIQGDVKPLYFDIYQGIENIEKGAVE